MSEPRKHSPAPAQHPTGRDAGAGAPDRQEQSPPALTDLTPPAGAGASADDGAIKGGPAIIGLD